MSVNIRTAGRKAAWRSRRRAAAAAGCGLVLFLAGCASGPRVPAHFYLQRAPVRVAVLPGANRTDHPEASIVFDKACEEALRRKGFDVISADQVVTYASAQGIALRDLTNLPPHRIGKDLKADMLIITDIQVWRTVYVVIQGKSEVTGSSRLIEAATDATVSRRHWHFEQQSGDGGGGGLGVLISAAVQAIADTAFDRCAQLGEQAARHSVAVLPYPGFAPPPPPP